MKRVTAVLIGSAAAGALVLGAMSLVGRASPAPTRMVTFEDRSTGALLTIETHPAATDAGRFALAVPGRGTFVGAGSASLRFTSAQPAAAYIVIADYDGDIELSTGTDLTKALGRVHARLDLAHHTAEATLWFGVSTAGRGSPGSDVERHHLVAGPAPTAGVRQTAEAFVRAMLSGDWGAIYDIGSGDLRSTASSREVFIAGAASQDVGKFRQLDITDVDEPSTHSLGFATAIVRVAGVREMPDGSRRSESHDVYLILEGRDWRLWFTVER